MLNISHTIIANKTARCGCLYFPEIFEHLAEKLLSVDGPLVIQPWVPPLTPQAVLQGLYQLEVFHRRCFYDVTSIKIFIYAIFVRQAIMTNKMAWNLSDVINIRKLVCSHLSETQ